MNAGLLDLLAWPIARIDDGLGLLQIPALLRVLIWGALAGMAGMWIYRRHSHQQRIAQLRTELADVQRQLAAHEGDFAGLWILIKRQLGLAFGQMRLSLVPAVLAGLPPLLLLPWLSNQYADARPAAGTPVSICVHPPAAAAGLRWSVAGTPPSIDGCWALPWPAADESVDLRSGDHALLTLPMATPVSIVHKREMFNLLIGNPAGYLDPDDPVEAVALDLPDVEFIHVGPTWLRGYLTPFFVAVLLASLWLKQRWKLY